MNKTLLLTALLAVMVLVSGLQTLQLLGLSAALSGASIRAPTTGLATASSGSSSASSGGSGSLANLPSMVGGC